MAKVAETATRARVKRMIQINHLDNVMVLNFHSRHAWPTVLTMLAQHELACALLHGSNVKPINHLRPEGGVTWFTWLLG